MCSVAVWSNVRAGEFLSETTYLDGITAESRQGAAGTTLGWELGVGPGPSASSGWSSRLFPRVLTPQSWGTKTQSETEEWILHKTMPGFENGEYYFCTK